MWEYVVGKLRYCNCLKLAFVVYKIRSQLTKVTASYRSIILSGNRETTYTRLEQRERVYVPAYSETFLRSKRSISIP